MSKIVVISGHPDLESSNANRAILNHLQRAFTSIDIRKLDQLYPDYNIDVKAEQNALLAVDAIVLQFPFYWYSVPALLKKWLDDVFSYQFAYGSEGDKLKGKQFFLSLTIGGPEDSYSPLGYNHFQIEQLLHPLEQTAYLAGLHYNPPIYNHGMIFINGIYNSLEEVQERAIHQAGRLVANIKNSLADPEIAA